MLMSCWECAQQSEVHMQQEGMAVQLLDMTSLSECCSMQVGCSSLGPLCPQVHQPVQWHLTALIHMRDQHLRLQGSLSTKCSRQS